MKGFSVFKEVSELAEEVAVASVMSTNIKTLRDDNTAEDAILLMSKNSLSSVIIIRSGKPIGILSSGDLIKKVFGKHKDPKKVLLKSIMSKEMQTIQPSMTIGAASSMMEKKGIRRLPIVNDSNKLIGLVTSTDLIKKTNEIYEANKKLLWNRGLINFLFMVLGMIFILLILNLFVK